MLQRPEEPSSDFGVLLVRLLTALQLLLIYVNPGVGRFKPLLSDAGNFFYFSSSHLQKQGGVLPTGLMPAVCKAAQSSP